jgi:iron complex outermembrane receptor protein
MKATDALTVTVGARYTDEEKDIAYVSRSDRGGLFDISTAELVAGGIPIRQTAREVTPKFGFEYRQSDDWLWYASATKGFKSGGWNARGSAPHIAASYLPFGPEFVWSYEGGFKSDLLDDRMRLNVTVFYADVDDLQLISGVTNPLGGVLFLTQNSGEARFRGAEIEWNWLPIEALNIYASLGLMDAEYTAIRPQPGQTITTSTQPVRSPDVTGNLGATWTLPIGDLGSVYVGGDVAFTGTHWVSSGNTPPASYVPRRWLYQAQVGYESPGGHWTANLSCKNCSDEEYITSWFIGPYMGDPRTWEFRLGYRFD